MAEVPAVAVLGSCISRDNFNSIFNPDYKQSFLCPLHQNQASIIALMSPAAKVTWEATGPMSKYDAWNLDTEFDHSFLANVRELAPAYLVLDFFADIHFGCLALPDGRYVTDNRWKVHKTDWYAAMTEGTDYERLSIFDDVDRYFALWTESFDRFDDFRREALPDTTVIVNRGTNVNRLRVADGKTVALQRNVAIKRLDVPRANELWRKLDDYAVERSGAEVIDLTDRAWTTSAEHPWGAFYVHYDMPYYPRFLAELHKIHARHTMGDEVSRLLEQVDAARRDEDALWMNDLENAVARQRKRIRKQQERLDQLTPADTRLRRLGRRFGSGRSGS